jgi:hypothetical protein
MQTLVSLARPGSDERDLFWVNEDGTLSPVRFEPMFPGDFGPDDVSLTVLDYEDWPPPVVYEDWQLGD